MSDPTQPAAPSALAATPTSAPAPVAPSLNPHAVVQQVTQPAAAASPAAAPQAAQAAEAKPDATKPVDTKPEPRQLNPYARIARKAADGAATSQASAAEIAQRYQQAEARVQALTTTVTQYAEQALASLPSQQMRDAVLKQAGNDPQRQLDAIALLRAAGAVNPALPQPASTAPVQSGPAANPTSADADIQHALAVQQLEKQGRALAASAYRQRHGAAIDAGNKKLAAQPARTN